MSVARFVSIAATPDGVWVSLNDGKGFALPDPRGQEFLDKAFLACMREAVDRLNPEETEQVTHFK
jgi:hypothetical protein